MSIGNPVIPRSRHAPTNFNSTAWKSICHVPSPTIYTLCETDHAASLLFLDATFHIHTLVAYDIYGIPGSMWYPRARATTNVSTSFQVEIPVRHIALILEIHPVFVLAGATSGSPATVSVHLGDS